MFAEELKSEGKCMFCEQLFSQKEIKTHLAKHLADIEKRDAFGKTQAYCHIEVVAAEMFLHLLVKGNKKMEIIDDFLRGIWLECCDHMSGFRQKNIEIEMDEKVQDIFKPAVNICSVCLWDRDSIFCEPCSKKHEKICNDFDEYTSMPIVNSPRMGVCGYIGGYIDTERDGVCKNT